MSTPLAIGSAELELSAAIMWAARARSPEEVERAERAVRRARAKLEAAKQAVHVVAARECCDMPMTWNGTLWVCSVGHD